MRLKLAMHGAVVLAVILVLAARSARADEGAADLWQAVRSYQYLRFCTQTWSEDPRALLAHFERERVDPRYDLSDRHVADDAWDGLLANARNLVDLRDFRMLDMLAVYLAHRDHPALAPGLMTKVEQALIDFKYWLTDPTPPGLIDQSVYWTENHQVTYYTLEYLAGTMFPDAVFGSDGQLGTVHKARAELALHRWLERKGRLGFSEWHSNVYYAASLRPLLLLVDFADEPDIATRAAMVVDLLVLDLALNTYESTFGVSHGRSYNERQDQRSARGHVEHRAAALRLIRRRLLIGQQLGDLLCALRKLRAAAGHAGDRAPSRQLREPRAHGHPDA